MDKYRTSRFRRGLGDRGDTSQSTVNIIKQAQAELLLKSDLVKQVEMLQYQRV